MATSSSASILSAHCSCDFLGFVDGHGDTSPCRATPSLIHIVRHLYRLLVGVRLAAVGLYVRQIGLSLQRDVLRRSFRCLWDRRDH